MKTVMLSVFAATPILVVGLIEDKRSQFVNEVHRHMQSKFDDLDEVKNGKFGISRVESDQIEEHGRKGGAPGYNSDDFLNMIWIFGNKGKPLDANAVTVRYTRNFSSMKSGFRLAPVTNPERSKELPMETAKAAITAFKAGRKPEVSLSNGPIKFDARLIRLTKRECLPCHQGMKLGDPVAVLVVSTQPLLKK